MKGAHRVLPPAQLAQVQEGLSQPPSQEPAAHGGPGQVQGREEGRRRVAPTAPLEQLQVPAGLVVQVHVRAGAVGTQAAQVRQGGALVAGQVLDDSGPRPARPGAGPRSRTPPESTPRSGPAGSDGPPGKGTRTDRRTSRGTGPAGGRGPAGRPPRYPRRGAPGAPRGRGGPAPGGGPGGRAGWRRTRRWLCRRRRGPPRRRPRPGR